MRPDHDGVRIRRGKLERLSVEFQLVLHRRVQRLVERHLRAEEDVFRCDGVAVGKFRAPPQMERPARPSGETSHDFAIIGTTSCLALS